MEGLKLPDKVKHILEDFVGKMKSIYKEELVSVILYGSAASGEYAGKYSNINVLVVLYDTGLKNLSMAADVVGSRKYRDLSALFFTPDYIKTSSDVFPLEFMDMKENHAVLYGSDVLQSIFIDPKNLRFQCEQELKSKTINMKRLYLVTKDGPRLKKLLFGSFTSSFHILRNMLRVKGITPAYSGEAALKEIQELFRIDMEVFYTVMDAKKKNLPLSLKETDFLFTAFVDQLEKIARIVDNI
ncbi:MAG: hypothetical protein WC592_03715 [Candidatus Omnitrophota bacterium]